MPQSNDSITANERLDFEDESLFSDDQDTATSNSETPWKILVVDDERQVHEVTRLALKNFTFENRALEIISAYSGQEAQAMLNQHPDTAVLLLDVVMETSQAGLELVKYIRENLHNLFVRII
ncbi:MAG: response regulator, partial [Cyanobacteria bacterium P01_A01_bin.17]